MYFLDFVVYTSEAKDENQLLECSLDPYFAEAESKKDGFTVRYGFLKCPGCKKISPPSKGMKKAPDIMQWLFKDCRGKFSATDLISENDTAICPACNALGVARTYSANLFVSDNRTSLYINRNESVAKALHFNHSTGKTYAEDAEKSLKTEITQNPSPVDFSGFIAENSPITKELFKMFSEKFYGGKSEAPRLHFISLLENLVLLNRFQGYAEPFYHAIPFSGTDLKLDEDFSSVLSDLRTTDDALKLFSTLNLPDHKAIKRLFFNRPELMFFADQIRVMPFKNTDIVRNFYATKDIFTILSGVKDYPTVVKCMERLIEKLNEGWIAEIAKNDFERILSSAAESLLTGKDFSLHDVGVTVRLKYFPYNCLLQRNPLHETVLIDGYTFFELRSTIEYDIAAEQLKNCLSDDSYHSETIICVKKDDEYVAAIQVADKTVYQAYLKNNVCIETDTELFSAYEKWLKRFDTTEDECMEMPYGDYEEDDLPVHF